MLPYITWSFVLATPCISEHEMRLHPYMGIFLYILIHICGGGHFVFHILFLAKYVKLKNVHNVCRKIPYSSFFTVDDVLTYFHKFRKSTKRAI